MSQSLYPYELSFDKEVMSWLGVKFNPVKYGMHYLLPPNILKNKGHEEGVGPISAPTPRKSKFQMSTDSKDEEDEEPLEWKLKKFPMFPQLPEHALL